MGNDQLQNRARSSMLVVRSRSATSDVLTAAALALCGLAGDLSASPVTVEVAQLVAAAATDIQAELDQR